MKNRFPLLLLAAVFATLSCKRTEVFSDELDRVSLEFTPSVDGVVSRAAANDIDVGTYGFNIAGYHTTGKIADAVVADPTKVYPNVFDYDAADGQDAVPLVKKNGDDRYVLSTVKWVLDEVSYLSYYAWAQNKVKDEVSGIVGDFPSKTNPGVPKLSIKNATQVSDQVDIVVAKYIDQPNNIVVSAVDLEFKHILAKLTFKAKSSLGADVTVTKLDVAYGANAVFGEATYQLADDKMVDLKGYQAGLTSLAAPHTITRGAEVLMGELLLIPQEVKKGFLRLTLAYTLTSGTGTFTQTKSVDLPASTLKSGANHAYMVDITADGVSVLPSKIGEWASDPVDRLPLIPGPRGDIQLLLDGYDPPYQHSDGKYYWLDKSGYNRHVEITGDNKASVYNATDYSYNFDGTTSLSAPYKIGSTTALTVDVVIEPSTSYTNNTFFNFQNGDSGVRPFYTHYGYQGPVVYFDTGNANGTQGRVSHTYTEADYSRRHMVSFLKGDNAKQALYYNATLLKEQNASSHLLKDLTLGAIGGGIKAKVFSFRVTKKAKSSTEVLATFMEQKSKFGVNSDALFTPPVKDGMILFLDGYTALKVNPTTKESYWEDRSADKNNGIMIGDMLWTGSGYRLMTGYVMPAGWGAKYGNIDVTIEIVYVRYKTTWRRYLVSGHTRRQADDEFNFRTVSIEEEQKTASLVYRCGFVGGNSNITLTQPIVQSAGSPMVLQATRSSTSQVMHYNNSIRSSGAATGYIAPTFLTFGAFVGHEVPADAFGGEIKAIVLHKRALTTAELEQNYAFYKVYYNID